MDLAIRNWPTHRVILALAFVCACGSKPAQPSGPPPSPVQSLSWLDGDWNTTHWGMAGGSRYGVMLEPTRFTVLIIDAQLRLELIVNGQPGAIMTGKSMGPQAAAFSTDDAAASSAVSMRREGGTLFMVFDVQNATYDVQFQRNAPVTAPALEAADRARTGVEPHIPIFSAIHGDAGYTVGTTASASYVTIWAKKNGSWSVAFDTTRPLPHQ